MKTIEGSAPEAVKGARAAASAGKVMFLVWGSPQAPKEVASSFMRVQAEGLRQLGWEVHYGMVYDRTSVRGIVSNIRRLRREAREAGVQIIHARYGSVIGVVGAMIRRGLPFVVTICGSDVQGTRNPGIQWKLRDAGMRLFSIFAASRADAVIAVSRNLAEDLPAPLRKRTLVLLDGVDDALFRPLDRAACRRELGWREAGRYVLLNLTGNTPDNRRRKNPELARAAVEVARRTHPDLVLHEMQSVPHGQVPVLMNAADCLLVTSRLEGSPNVVKEAMACNVPVVAVRVGDVEERLAGVKPGALCGYDAEELGRALVEVLREGRRSNGRQEFERQGLSSAAVAAQVAAIYRRLLGGAGSHAS